MPRKTTKTYVHVNQHVIRSNKKHNKNEPVITVKKGSKNTYCHEVKILGPSTVVYGGNDNNGLMRINLLSLMPFLKKN